MRALALDIGEVRVGVAVCDPAGRVASPVCVLPAQEVLQHASTFRRVLEDWEPDVLVCGRPKTMAGEDGPQAERIMSQARQIADACGLPLEFADERLSSQEAKRRRASARRARPVPPAACARRLPLTAGPAPPAP